jgi:hypothetical protein
MTMIVGDVLTVSLMWPTFFRQKMVLRRVRPIAMPVRMFEMLTLYFLQKNNVGIEQSQALAQLVHHHATIKLRKSLVDIPGRQSEHKWVKTAL